MPTFQLNKKILISEDVVWRKYGSKIGVFNTKEGSFQEINEDGAKIWELCVQQRTTEEIVRELCKDYQLHEEEVQEKVLSFLESCEKNNLLNLEK